MTKLSDTQLIILNAAARRDDLNLLPLPGSLRGGAAKKVVGALLTRGLAAEIVTESRATADAGLNVFWRNDPDGRAVLLRATPAALDLLGLEIEDALPEEDAPEAVAPETEAADALAPASMTIDEAFEHAARETAAANDAPSPRAVAMRDGTKQATLIALLRRPEGATLAEMAEATQWQVHTCRGALAGALKKRLGLEVTSEKTERGRAYKLPPV